MHWLRFIAFIFTTTCCRSTSCQLRLLHTSCCMLLRGWWLGRELLLWLLLLSRVEVPRQGLQLAVSVHTPFVPLVPCIEACTVALHQNGLQTEQIDKTERQTG
jgi:hypothetical protein